MNKEKFFLFLSITLILASCGKPQQAENVVQENNSKSENKEIPKTFSFKKGQLNIQADVEVPDGIDLDKVPIGIAKINLLDTEKVIKDLVGERPILEQFQDEGENEDLKAYTEEIIYLKDGSFLCLNPTYVSYFVDITYNIDNAFWEEYGTERYNEELFRNKQLEFASEKDIYRKVQDLLRPWGIEIGKYNFDGLDHETLKKEEYPTDRYGNYDESAKKTEWTEADDCYYFKCSQELQGIPVYYLPYGVMRANHNAGSAINVKYGPCGLVELVINRPYTIQDTQTTAAIISVEEAVGKLDEKFDTIITTDTIQIEHITLMLIPQRNADKEYDLIPVWVFEGNVYMEGEGQTNCKRDKFMFNAVTGEEIVL